MTSSEFSRQFCIKSQLIPIARGLLINNQKLVGLLFQSLPRKHETRSGAFSKSLSIFFHLLAILLVSSYFELLSHRIRLRRGKTSLFVHNTVTEFLRKRCGDF